MSFKSLDGTSVPLVKKDGFLDADSLHETMEAFFGQDLARQQILETISEIDYDNDGKISYREFLEVMCALKNADRGRRTKFGNFYKVLTLKNPPFLVPKSWPCKCCLNLTTMK